MKTPKEGRPCRVLVGEDNPDLVGLLRVRLSDAPFRTEFANTGELTLFLFGAAKRDGDPYDLLILDIAMPLKTGSTVAREIQEEGSKTPIVMVTAMSAEEAAEQVKGLNLAGLFFKPGIYEGQKIISCIVAQLEALGCDVTGVLPEGEKASCAGC